MTEDADKIRSMMGNHSWGHGAPVPTVRQALNLSRTRSDTKKIMSDLCGVLAAHIRELKKSDYDNYFQRAMCMQWDDLHGYCGAGCDDCDSCTEFIRIQPQYCVRCGATFFERQENRRCAKCRAERKKQAYKKYKHLRGARPTEDEYV